MDFERVVFLDPLVSALSSISRSILDLESLMAYVFELGSYEGFLCLSYAIFS